MVNINTITPRRELQLRRDIMVWDAITKTGTINGILFDNEKVLFSVFKVLLHWDFKSKLHNDSIILHDLIRDSELTSLLRYALGYTARDENYPSMELLLPLGDTGDDMDDMSIMNNMIDELSNSRINDIFYLWINRMGANDKYRRAMYDIRSYLVRLRDNMIGDETLLQEIVECELECQE